MANKCGGCGKFLSSSQSGTIVSCGSCSGRFHKGCAMLPGSESVVGKDWACPDCRAKVRKGDNSNTPVKGPLVGTDPRAAALSHADGAGDAASPQDASGSLK